MHKIQKDESHPVSLVSIDSNIAVQLEQLNKHDNSLAGIPKVSAHLTTITSPIQADYWKVGLADHPDQKFAALIVRGLERGFRIGFADSSVTLKASKRNLISAMEHPDVVSNYIAKELDQRRVARVGSVADPVCGGIHLSPLGAIPKKSRKDQWRLIMDLSAPQGHSVNEGISKELCTCHYTSVDQAAEQIVRWGKGTLMAKMDIKQAYRNIPIAAEDRHLLGFQWNGNIFIDKVLPFGLRSAPFIFTAVADALTWIMTSQGVTWAVHYIDDFLTLGRPHSEECQNNKELMESICTLAGLPLEPEKSQGPTTRLTFLGIEMDSEEGVLRLPPDKLRALREALQAWRGKKACRKRDLLSLIGSLSHACKVVRAGRAFLRRLIDLSASAKELDHFIRLNQEARSDIEWWASFVEPWNGISLINSVTTVQPQITVTSDASGSWGCGAFWGTRWFQMEWDGLLFAAHIAIKEMVPVVIASAIWGREWEGKSIRILSDNAAVVAAINNNTSRVKEIAHLLRCLAFVVAQWQCHLSAAHIPGAHNTVADAISRNNLANLRILYPQLSAEPDRVPAELIQLLIGLTPDWTSPVWTKLWRNIFHRESPHPLRGSMRQELDGIQSFANDGN